MAVGALVALAVVPAPAAPGDAPANVDTKAKSNGSSPPKHAPVIPDYGLPQVARINEEIRQVWTDNGMTPSPPATDGEWCRRVYLDILGRIPSVQELREFVNSKEADKKSKLVNKLLYDETYTEEYARNWTTIWTNILIGRNGGTEQTAR